MEKIRLQLMKVLIGDISKIDTDLKAYLQDTKQEKRDQMLEANLIQALNLTLNDLASDKYFGLVQIYPVHLLSTMYKIVNSIYRKGQNQELNTIMDDLNHLLSIQSEMQHIHDTLEFGIHKELYDKFDNDMQLVEELVNIYLVVTGLHQSQIQTGRTLLTLDEMFTVTKSDLFQSVIDRINKYKSDVLSTKEFKLLKSQDMYQLCDDIEEFINVLKDKPTIMLCPSDIVNVEQSFNQLVLTFTDVYRTEILENEETYRSEYGGQLNQPQVMNAEIVETKAETKE